MHTHFQPDIPEQVVIDRVVVDFIFAVAQLFDFGFIDTPVDGRNNCIDTAGRCTGNGRKLGVDLAFVFVFPALEFQIVNQCPIQACLVGAQTDSAANGESKRDISSRVFIHPMGWTTGPGVTFEIAWIDCQCRTKREYRDQNCEMYSVFHHFSFLNAAARC